MGKSLGLDSVLDFRLAEGIYGDPNNAPLRDVIMGRTGPQTLFNRIEGQRKRALNRGELGHYLITFVDNHDSFWQPGGRISNSASDNQVIGAIGFVICTLGTPSIYYGTEQGFAGGGGDNQVREAMFDSAPGGHSLLNSGGSTYREISRIVRSCTPTEYSGSAECIIGRFPETASISVFPFGSTYSLAFSRLLYGAEVLVSYNVSSASREDSVVVDATLYSPTST